MLPIWSEVTQTSTLWPLVLVLWCQKCLSGWHQPVTYSRFAEFSFKTQAVWEWTTEEKCRKLLLCQVYKHEHLVHVSPWCGEGKRGDIIIWLISQADQRNQHTVMPWRHNRMRCRSVFFFPSWPIQKTKHAVGDANSVCCYQVICVQIKDENSHVHGAWYWTFYDVLKTRCFSFIWSFFYPRRIHCLAMAPRPLCRIPVSPPEKKSR